MVRDRQAPHLFCARKVHRGQLRLKEGRNHPSAELSVLVSTRQFILLSQNPEDDQWLANVIPEVTIGTGWDSPWQGSIPLLMGTGFDYPTEMLSQFQMKDANYRLWLTSAGRPTNICVTMNSPLFTCS